jgi:hypothetical protein
MYNNIRNPKKKNKKKKRFIVYQLLLCKIIIIVCGILVIFFNFYIDPYSTNRFIVNRTTKNNTSTYYESTYSYYDSIQHRNDRILNKNNHPNQQQQAIPPPSSTTNNNIFCTWAIQQNSMNLFIQNLYTILIASQHPLDPHYFLYNTTYHTLLQIIPRLFKSTKTLPIISPSTITKLLQKIEHRYEYITNPTLYILKYNTTPSPITITILGGSVTMGVNCYTGIPRLDLQRCSWPIRLEYFMNHMIHQTIILQQPQQQQSSSSSQQSKNLPFVKIETLAMGGTNTATGQIILEYDILNELHPDILINAYSTNDMHILTVKDATSNEKLYDKLLQMGQNFTRTFYHRQQEQQQQCRSDRKNTILLWLDDYIGNEQREILSIQTLSQTLHILSNYYGFGYISYADTVRDLIYSDTTETMFSPSGWYTTSNSNNNNNNNNNNTDTKMKREIHPGQGMHIATVWIVAYNIVTMLISQCNILSLEQTIQNDSSSSNAPRDKVLAEGIRNNQPIQAKVKLYPYETLPPPLTSNLTLDAISTLWQTSTNIVNTTLDCLHQQQKQVSTSSDGSTEERRCPISWISGLPQRDIEWIQNYFEPYIQTPNEWEIVDHSIRKDKYGWMPKILQNYDIIHPQPKKLILEFDISAIEMIHDIRTITLFYLKSYGKRWRSAVQVVVEQKLTNGEYTVVTMNDDTKHVVLLSHHDKNTSELLSTTIAIPNDDLEHNNNVAVRNHNTAITTTAIRLTFTLIRGRRFKLMGIILCK